MSFKCLHCNGTHEHSSEGRRCWEAGGLPVDKPAPPTRPAEPPAPSPVSPPADEPVKEAPYRSRPGHNLYVNIGPKIEAWNEASATASGHCDCGHWERYGMPNPTSVVLNWNRHVDDWEN